MSNPIIEDIKAKFKSNDPITVLIAINVAVFIVLNILLIFSFLSGHSTLSILVNNFIFSNITFPLSIPEIAFKPWTAFTYMFVHKDFFHIFWNMISLYWFGKILMSYTSSKKIIPLYILGGLAGAIITLCLISFIPSFKIYQGIPMLGASAGVTAILVATATLVPNSRINLMFIGQVKLIYLATFVLFIDVISIASYSNVGGNLSHLGGALMGYIFILQYKKGKNLGKPINQILTWISNFISRKKTAKMKVVYKRPVSDEDFNYQKNVKQQEIDAILDKISKSGYESLSKKEKEILFNASKK